MGSEQQEISVPADPVGQQLQRAREAKGWSVSAITEQQHLRCSVVQAIESGDYSKIDTELFLKGYVRAYARQVGLDADAVIRDLDAELAPMRKQREDELQTHPLVDIERRRRRKRRLVKSFLVVLLLALLGYLAFHYLTPGRVGIFDGTGSDAPELSVGEQHPDTNEALSEPLAGSPSDDAPMESLQALSVTPSPELLEEPEALSITDIPVDQGAALQTEEEPNVEAPQQAAEEIEPASAGSDTVFPVGRLEMTFSDDCWIQVTDANGQRLASELRRRGDTLDVSGPPPLKVVVGAMNAVEVIRFQGERLEMDDFRVVNNRSEFTLEP